MRRLGHIAMYLPMFSAAALLLVAGAGTTALISAQSCGLIIAGDGVFAARDDPPPDARRT